jgi:phosphoglycolate phosphatase-like HAD superfamily hydrolase
MKRLILFDIDGTLITAGGAGTRSMNRAFHALFGIEDAFRGISMAGKTDPQIMREGLKMNGYPHWDGNVDAMKERYLDFLKEEINNPDRQLKPGVQSALDVFKQEGMSLGLLTGNLEQGAAIKLKPFGIYDYFIDGAFGSDHEDRNKLLPIAVRKFTARGDAFSSRECIVIGDTPRDVECAKINGAHCIAVATGPYSKEDLLRTDADIVLDSLQNKDIMMNFIRSLPA